MHVRLRLTYNGNDLLTDAGVPLTKIAIATGIWDPDEVSLVEFLESLAQLGYTTITIRLVVKPQRKRRTKAKPTN
jgi:hypothetical protein